MKGLPARGLPARVYVPIVVVTMLVFLSVIGYFLKVALGVTGAALGPQAQQGDAVVAAGPNQVGGGTPPQAAAAAPPLPVARMLVELRDRIERNPRDDEALAALANMYSDAGKYPQAIGYYRRALAVDPANPNTRTDYASALHATGDDPGALVQLRTVLASHPDFAAALFNEGVVAHAVGRRSLAVAALRKFLQVAPDDARAPDARAALQQLGA